MDCVQEAFDEFNKRKALLGGCVMISELTSIIVAYSVSEYELFEEALFRRNFMMGPGACPISHQTIKEFPHFCTRRYVRELAAVDMRKYHPNLPTRTPEQRLTHAMRICGVTTICCRLQCFYRLDNLRECTCLRPLMPHNIQAGLVMPF